MEERRKIQEKENRARNKTKYQKILEKGPTPNKFKGKCFDYGKYGHKASNCTKDYHRCRKKTHPCRKKNKGDNPCMWNNMRRMDDTVKIKMRRCSCTMIKDDDSSQRIVVRLRYNVSEHDFCRNKKQSNRISVGRVKRVKKHNQSKKLNAKRN